MTIGDASGEVFERWYARQRERVAAQLQAVFAPLTHPVYELCAYHMGWRDEAGNRTSGNTGKMFRPVLCLAACQAYGETSIAVAPAAAIELLHAFSLVHDDIEDGDQERRHRPTLWSLRGVPLALNAGDALFALAFDTLHGSIAPLVPARAVRALKLFSGACLRLAEGQHLDLEFESRPSVGIEEYLNMTRGKTGALLGASLAIGALFGGADDATISRLQQAGIELGVAFQARDDLLSFWGDPILTGKAAGNDLIRGKKSLPIVLAAERGIEPARLSAASFDSLQGELEALGVREAAEQFAAEHARRARAEIEAASPSHAAGAELQTLVSMATIRDA